MNQGKVGVALEYTDPSSEAHIIGHIIRLRVLFSWTLFVVERFRCGSGRIVDNSFLLCVFVTLGRGAVYDFDQLRKKMIVLIICTILLTEVSVQSTFFYS